MTAAGRVGAIAAADETLEMLDIDQGYVIDPFAAIEQMGLTLHITKLDNLLGAIVPEGTGGVLITSERNSTIQRYTAAHEIGHWVLHANRFHADADADVNGPPSSEVERQAQIFASYLLMPPPLLNDAVTAYGLRPKHIEPEHIYRLSRDLDVSYEAMARRLHAGRFLTAQQRDHVLSIGRMKALLQASRGHRPDDGWADMWDASSDEDRVSLLVEEHDEVLVNLIEQRLAGWRWQTADELAARNGGRTMPRPRPTPPRTATHRQTHDGLQRLDQRGAPDQLLAAALSAAAREIHDPDDQQDGNGERAAVVIDTFAIETVPESHAQRRRRRQAIARPVRSGGIMAVAAETPVGGNGTRTLVVRTGKPGAWSFQLFYAHAYDPADEPLFTYELLVTVQPNPNTAFRTRQLASDLDRRLPGDPDDDLEFEVDVA